MRSLTDSDIAFLKELQHELQTQDNFGTADPHYWHILEKKMVRTFEGNGEVGIIDEEGDVFLGNKMTIRLLDELESIDMEDKLPLSFGDGESYSYEEEYEFAKAIWEEYCGYRFHYELGYFTFEYKVAYPLFFTYKECKEHIKRYGHNYSHPQAYCIYSDRTPNFERLLDILTNVDFDQLKTGGQVNEQ